MEECLSALTWSPLEKSELEERLIVAFSELVSADASGHGKTELRCIASSADRKCRAWSIVLSETEFTF